MSQFRILVEGPPETFNATGEVYDDTNGPVQDRLDELQKENGVCYAAALILP